MGKQNENSEDVKQQGSAADYAASAPGTQQQESNSANQSDVNALKDQNGQTKDSDHKQDNAANAKDTSGHYQPH